MSQAEQMKQQFMMDIAKRRRELFKQLTQYNHQEQDLLHFIENEQYDAVVMVKVAKQLKTNRQQRRAVKVEIDQLNNIGSHLGRSDLTQLTNKTYEYRTNILLDTAHRTKGMTTPHKKITQQND